MHPTILPQALQSLLGSMAREFPLPKLIGMQPQFFNNWETNKGSDTTSPVETKQWG